VEYKNAKGTANVTRAASHESPEYAQLHQWLSLQKDYAKGENKKGYNDWA
jgi:hypothetical protein